MIYCIMGMSGAGKTTIARKVSKRLNIPLIISYTSRPMRPGEVKGVDYHYVDNKHFDDNKDDFIEMREYTVYDGSVWKYGYKKSDFKCQTSDYIVVIETDGFNSFKEYFGIDQIQPILINSQIEQLYARLKNRGDNQKEIERRIADDKRKFDNFTKREKCKNVYNYFDLEYAIKQTMKLIMKGDK